MPYQHIRFLSTHCAICQAPERLGTEFIFIEPFAEKVGPCGECSKLLLTHNEQAVEEDKELVRDMYEYNSPRLRELQRLVPGHSQAGVVAGVFLGSLILGSIAFMALLVLWMVYG